jgi:hypothetical protein
MDRHRNHCRQVGLRQEEIDRSHAVPRLVHQSADCGKGHLLGHGQHQALEQLGQAGNFAEPVGLDLNDPTVGQLHPQRPDLQEAFVLEKIEMSQPLGPGVMNLVQAPRRRAPEIGSQRRSRP